ncbi:MAG: PAS domain-containing protein [Desulfovibrio sp.]|jgi:two-component system phosphate regulon sensor histidine kinase PhoR|nr:PAS domain-containing protein [Desulfovibrio sp.]
MARSAGTLRAKLFWALALITVLAALGPLFFLRDILYRDRVDLAGRQALAQASLLKEMLDAGLGERQSDAALAAARKQSLRLTLTDASGRVLRDSHVQPERIRDLDNHSDRPEIAAALAGSDGLALRHSNSLGMEAMYAAVPLESGGVLRMAVPLADISRAYEQEAGDITAILMIAAGCCLLLAFVISAWIRNSLASMAEAVASISREKGRRLHSVPAAEFLPLARAVNHMADSIEEYVRTTLDQQAQLEIILNSMNEGVLVLDPAGAIRRGNRAVENLFPRVEGARGRQLIEAIPVPALQRKVEQILAGQETVPFLEEGAVHFEMPPGRFFVAGVTRPVEPNDSLGVVIVIYDATEIMRLETVRRDFVANVSHELRTPLTAIGLSAESLLNSDMDPEHKKRARVIEKHASALACIVDNLLELARVENARQKIPLAPLDPRLPLREAVAACREAASSRRISLREEIPAGLLALGNGPLLTQVFRNLLENACRHSPEEGEIAVLAREENGEAVFLVADNGPGIPQAELSRIFERFYQVEKGRNGATAGIGLAICKHIVERHGGRIWAESPGEGFATAFFFTLRTPDSRPQ